MPEDRFDAIIVGAGVAGGAAAYVLAEAGLEVLLLERGDAPGSKNITGGRLYTHNLERLIPGFVAEAPLQRRVVKESVTLLTGGSGVTLDFESRLPAGGSSDSYTILRAEFDQWLAGKAEQAGCQLALPVRVDDLLRKDGQVCGIIAGPDEIEAEVVILAEGVNGLLSQKAGIKQEVKPVQVAVGIKEIIELPPSVINDRFHVEDGEGAARMFVGAPTGGLIGGGFLYTNKESLSLGLVFNVGGLAALHKIPDLLEDFKQHPVDQTPHCRRRKRGIFRPSGARGRSFHVAHPVCRPLAGGGRCRRAGGQFRLHGEGHGPCHCFGAGGGGNGDRSQAAERLQPKDFGAISGKAGRRLCLERPQVL